MVLLDVPWAEFDLVKKKLQTDWKLGAYDYCMELVTYTVQESSHLDKNIGQTLQLCPCFRDECCEIDAVWCVILATE